MGEPAPAAPAARFNADRGNFFKRRRGSAQGGRRITPVLGGGAAPGSPAKRALRTAVTEAFVWSSLDGDFIFQDVRPRKDIVSEIKLGHAAMRELDDLFDQLDADSNGGVELRDFQMMAISKDKAQEVWDEFRTWCFNDMDVRDNAAISIERREYMRAMKRDIHSDVADVRFNPVTHKLDGQTMELAIPFVEKKLDEVARTRVQLFTEHLKEFIKPRDRMHMHRGGEPDFPDLGDVHNIMYSVPLTPTSAHDLMTLWQNFDSDGDGTISHRDFVTEGELEIWSELKDKFDADGDGTVDGAEFVEGFQNIVTTTKPLSFANESIKLSATIHHFTVFASEEMKKTVDEVAVFCGFKKAKSGAARFPDIKQHFGSVEVSEEALSTMHQIFVALDTDRSGELEMSDFLTRVGEKREAAKQYEALWQSFDADNDARITFVEFATKIISHVVDAPQDPIDRMTIEEQIKAINTSLNGELISQCTALKEYFGV